MYKNNYNIFLLLSNISRNLLEIFSITLLYKLNYTIKQLLLYYLVFYFVGIIVNVFVIYISNYVKIKYILILSNLFFCVSYYYLNNMDHQLKNLIIFSVLSSISSFTYHVIRHYLAIIYTKKTDKEIGNILIFTILGISISSYIGAYIIEKYNIFINIIIVFIISIISIIPIKKIKLERHIEKIENISIPPFKKVFFLMEQAKVLFLIFEPLYLYIYISSSLKYIAIFNALVTISSIITIYIVIRKIDIEKNYKYLNILLFLILFLKLNMRSSNILLIVAFFEGIFIKIYEIVSMKNLYQVESIINNPKSYILKAEIIFCISRIIFLLVFYILTDNIKIILYILLVFILLSGFSYKQTKK